MKALCRFFMGGLNTAMKLRQPNQDSLFALDSCVMRHTVFIWLTQFHVLCVNLLNLISIHFLQVSSSLGKTVCACFNVGVNTLIETIQSQSLTTPEEVGEILSAGTNCGSCVPEIREIIQQENKNNI